MINLPINKILNGDCLEKLKELPDNSVDAIITDTPYGLEFMGKEWDSFKDKGQGDGWQIAGKPSLDKFDGKNDWHSKSRPAFRGHNLEHWKNLQKFSESWAKEALRVLKPGGYLLSFGGTRTYHRMTCGIEDAGFEIRDCILWIYGQGFPKSLNIGKQISKKQGAVKQGAGSKGNTFPLNHIYQEYELTEDAKQWEGWGTALKPACEPIVVARKPLSEKNVALNVLKWGTGGINIDESRIGTNELTGRNNKIGSNIYGGGKGFPPVRVEGNLIGRFPANIILDEESAKMLDEQANNKGAFAPVKSGQKGFGGVIYGKYNTGGDDGKTFYGDGLGGASRFFYVAKSSKSERNYGCEELPEQQLRKEDNSAKSLEIFSNQYTESSENPTGRGKTPLHRNNHPTVKPIKLMEYLIKLVSREGSIILDPFLGSGTTAIACIKTNRNFIGIEKESEYIKIAEKRLKPYLEQTKL